MKSFIFILSFLSLGAMTLKAQQATGPAMTFEVTTIDYGKIEQGADPVRKFKFTNTGNQPLVITNAQGSCGCTVPTYPKEPIMPGASANIDVRYDTQRVGPFTKTVTLTTNEVETSNHLLTIKGEVSQPATPAMSLPLRAGAADINKSARSLAIIAIGHWVKARWFYKSP